VLALVLVYSGIGYFTGAVPFPVEPRGDICAGDLCGAMGSVGDRGRAAAELRNTLPTSREYSSSGDNPSRARDDISWRATCQVYGDGDLLLYTHAELGWDADARTWLDHQRPRADLVDEEGKPARFQAGSAAILMHRTALILVPCTPAYPGPAPVHLEVEVHVHYPLEGSAEENRRALVTVALGAARSAHDRAECPLPAQLPTQVTGLG